MSHSTNVPTNTWRENQGCLYLLPSVQQCPEASDYLDRQCVSLADSLFSLYDVNASGFDQGFGLILQDLVYIS